MKKTSLLPMALLVAGWLLAACGGGGGSESAPQAADPLREIPASASQSPSGLVGYLKSLLPLDAEAREPMSLEGFAAPTSDDTEPIDVGG